MTMISLTYQDLLAQFNKLKLENKQLRLRPSLHSTDANILEFLNIKSQMAEATLSATNILEATEVSLHHLIKITNIHSVSFFRIEKNQSKIELLKQSALPKKFITNIHEIKHYPIFHKLLFPTSSKLYLAGDFQKDAAFSNQTCLEPLLKYKTILILPLIKLSNFSINLMLLSDKALKNDRYFKILTSSIRAQLRSSFSRIFLMDERKEQTVKLEAKIKSRTQDFEKMNTELIRQITTHRKKEQDFSEKLELFRSIITQQKDLVLRINNDGHILYFNPQFNHVKKLNEGLKENLLNYFGEGDFPGLDRIIQDFESGILSVDCEIQLHIGSFEWFDFYFSPIKNKRNVITEIQIVARNINEIKKLEKKLKAQKGMLYQMLETSDKISFSIDRSGLIQLVSNNWQKYTGNLQSTAINRPFKDFAHPEDIKNITTNILKLHTKKEQICQFNFRLKYADNHWHWQKSEIKTIHDNRGRILYFVGSFHPINKEKAIK